MKVDSGRVPPERSFMRKPTTGLLLLSAALVIWQLFSWTGVLPLRKIPSPVQVVSALYMLTFQGLPPEYLLHGHVLASLVRVFGGFFFAAVTAIPLGILMGWNRPLRIVVTPFVEILRPIPPLAWIPIAILWFGIGIKSAAFIIFLGVFFPILLNTVSGVLSADVRLIEAAKVLGAKPPQILLKVLTQGALPSVFTGVRIGLGVGWMTLVAAEFTGVKNGYGLGYLIMIARDIQRADAIVAGMIVIGLVGYSIDGVVKRLERRLLEWM